MTPREHNNLLGIFFFVQAGLQLFGGIIAIIIYGGMGTFMLTASREDGAQAMGGIFIVAAIFVAIFIFAFAAFYAYAGMKIRKHESIGRVLGIIGSILALLSFPLGTALGIYGLWFLLGEQGKSIYSGEGLASSTPPPPPHGWQ